MPQAATPPRRPRSAGASRARARDRAAARRARARPASPTRSAARPPRPPAPARAPPGLRSTAASVRSTSSEWPGSGPQSASRPRTIQKASKRGLTGWPDQHQPRCRVGGAQDSLQPLEHPGQAPAPAHQGGGALVAPAGGGLLDAAVDLAQQVLPGLRALEVGERAVQLAAVGVRVQVAEAGGDAAAHLPVGRRVLAQLQRPAAVAQPVERGELVGQLRGERPAAQRPDVHGVPHGGLGGHLQHRVGDVQPAAQEHVAVGALELAVARGLPLLDQPVLEHQRAELRVGGAVVHDLGPLGPARRGAEVRARAGAQRHRLAHVQRAAAVVAEHVDARVVGQRGEVGALGRGGWPPPGSVLRARRRERSRSRASPTVTAFAHRRGKRAQNTRAQVRASGSARCTSFTSMPSAVGQGAPARACGPGGRSAGPARPCTGPGGRGQSRPARSNAWRRTRVSKRALCATSTRPSSSPAISGQHLVHRGGAVHHPLGDAGEALDAPGQRALGAHERVEGLVQLAARPPARRPPR